MLTYRATALFYKTLTVVLSCLLLLSCKNREISQTTFHTQEIHKLENRYNFRVVEVDDCHYLLLEVDRNNPHEGFGFFSHRGNCPNPIHYQGREDVLRLYTPSQKDILEGVPLRQISSKKK